MLRSFPYRRSCATIAAVALSLPLAACSNDDDETASPSGGSPSAAPAREQELVVFAAASLTDTFTELGERFEAENPGVTVTFSFGSSATLATQINEGAPVDVFASASPATMQTVTDAGNGEGTAAVFARNLLEIAVPAGNPGEVDGLDDFADPDLDIALCASEVPCGAAADKVFAAADIEPRPDTRESDVRATLTKVELGEVDAALVYRTDVDSANGKVEGIEFDEAEEAINDYLIVALKEAEEPGLAADWVEFIQSGEAQAVLEEAGFDPVEAPSDASTEPSASPTS